MPILFFLIGISAMAQEKILLEGEIINGKTNELVSFAHLKVLKSSLGTISNGQGKFSLLIPARYTGEELQVSCIGYKTKVVKIPADFTSQNSLPISLEENLRVLGAVTVLSGNPALEIMEKAIDRIEVNYPASEEKLDGFYRELASADSMHVNPYYVAEAVLEVHKSNYGKKSQDGDVKLIKGRKYIGPSYDSLEMRLYAGAHHAHRFDFVMRREAPLNKSDLRKYNFQIQDTLRYENENLILISFNPLKGSGGHGQLYITQDTYAFVKGVFYKENLQKDWLNQLKGLVGNYKRSYLNYITEYVKQNSLWRYKYSEYHTVFNKGVNAALFINSTFTVTDFVADDQRIPYVERIQYNDVFLTKTGEYDHGFWEGYNIVPYKPSLNNISDEIGDDWNNAEENGNKKKTSKSLFKFLKGTIVCKKERASCVRNK